MAPRRTGSLPRRVRAGTAMLTVALAAGIVAAALAGCGGGSSGTANGRLVVVATTTQIGDIVGHVAGNRVQVETMVRPNQDPHDYDPTPGDVADVASSALVFKNGAGLDDWLDRVLQNAGGSRPIVDLSRSAHLRTQGGEPDPHYWMDPTNVEAMVPAIRDALTQIDPAGADAFAANARAYVAAVQQMDAANRALIDTLPPDARRMVTNHDAFRYYTEHYGITYVGSVLQGFSTTQEPTTGQLADLLAQIRAQDVKAIFTEQSVSPRLAQVLASEAGIRVISTLYADSLGPAGSGADTYIGMMETDTREIVDGLK